MARFFLWRLLLGFCHLRRCLFRLSLFIFLCHCFRAEMTFLALGLAVFVVLVVGLVACTFLVLGLAVFVVLVWAWSFALFLVWLGCFCRFSFWLGRFCLFVLGLAVSLTALGVAFSVGFFFTARFLFFNESTDFFFDFTGAAFLTAVFFVLTASVFNFLTGFLATVFLPVLFWMWLLGLFF